MTPGHLADLLEASARRFPDRLAVVDDLGNQATYAELNRQADAIAASLSACGVSTGDRVGVALAKRVAAVSAQFGVMKAGAAYVPVDLTAPAERSRRILTDCQVRALIVDGGALDVVPAGDDAARWLETVIVAGAFDTEAIDGSPIPLETILHRGGSAPAFARNSDDLAYIIYTSGSTGVPKGVMITHANVLAFLDWCSSVFSPSEHDRFSGYAPFHFDPSVIDLYLTIKHGAAVYLISNDLAKNPEGLARFVAQHQLTVWNSTPSILTLLLRFGNLAAHDASSLRLVGFGGEVFPVKYLRELQRRWPSPTYYNFYGPTETTVACTSGQIPSAIPDDRDAPYPIGFACDHCQTLVLDKGGREVAPGQEGVLHIGGRAVFAGYWARPAETAAAFVEHAGARWYNTGDIVTFDPVDGFTYVGRSDRMVKRRGYRIELDEIERTLYAHEDVREAAVVAVTDEDAGTKIIAFLVCEADRNPSAVELKTFCSKTLPAYMSPDRFVVQRHLSRTSTDKVDYQTLAAQSMSALAR